MLIKSILNKLDQKKSLNLTEIKFFIEKTISGDINLKDQKSFLLKLNNKGYGADEIANFITVLSDQMPYKLNMPKAIDICGTGGSGLPRINTSTITAIILSACGVPIAKHGNKAASGRFGSFDLLEGMGMNISPKPEVLESIYKNLGLAFIFARQFHPAMKHFAQVRSELETKTIFNILGPLLNPANPDKQIIGASNQKDMQLIIESCQKLNKKHVIVVCGEDNLDELTLTGYTHIMELKGGKISKYKLHPKDFGLKAVSFKQIAGGDANSNIKITKNIIQNKCKTNHLDLVLANVSLILKFAGLVKDFKSGMKMAYKAIKDGQVLDRFNSYVQMSNTPDILLKIKNHKVIEVEKLKIEESKKEYPLNTLKKSLKKSDRDFKSALSGTKNLSLICEIKRASPSNPKIDKKGLKTDQIARIYEKNGASAISVITDNHFFKGSLADLQVAKKATTKTPILMKDFIIDEHQIYLARFFGADAILLIVALLDQQTIDKFIKIAKNLKMDVLLEVHNKQELDISLQTSAKIIGINNRNLHTFEIDTKTTLRLLSDIPKGRIVVAESGYDERNIGLIQGLCNAALIGSSIMSSKDIAKKLISIQSPQKLFKVCGVRDKKTASYCEKNEISLIGLNFVKKSHRSISANKAQELRPIFKQSIVVGVFQNQSASEVNKIADKVNLDFVQLSGDESPAFCKKINYPIIKTIKIDKIPSKKDLKQFDSLVHYYIVDGGKPGSGQAYDYEKINSLKLNKPFFVAGGINEKNVSDVLKKIPSAIGIDTASGVEANKKIDVKKSSTLKSLTLNLC